MPYFNILYIDEMLFDVESNTITYHLGEIYKSGELEQITTTRKIRVVQNKNNTDIYENKTTGIPLYPGT